MTTVRIQRFRLSALTVACIWALVLVATVAEPQQFARASVYATQPRNPSAPVLAGGLTVDEAGGAPLYATQLTHPSGPVLAGGLTVDEAGGAPLYATQLTHPSGPVMEGGNDLQPYGRDSVYVAH